MTAKARGGGGEAGRRPPRRRPRWPAAAPRSAYEPARAPRRFTVDARHDGDPICGPCHRAAYGRPPAGTRLVGPRRCWRCEEGTPAPFDVAAEDALDKDEDALDARARTDQDDDL